MVQWHYSVRLCNELGQCMIVHDEIYYIKCAQGHGEIRWVMVWFQRYRLGRDVRLIICMHV